MAEGQCGELLDPTVEESIGADHKTGERARRGIAVAAIAKRANASSARASMEMRPVRHSRKFPNAHVAPLRAG
jgi:hypothetical protein